MKNNSCFFIRQLNPIDDDGGFIETIIKFYIGLNKKNNNNQMAFWIVSGVGQFL